MRITNDVDAQVKHYYDNAEGKISEAVSGQDFPADNDTLYFAGAFVNLRDFGIAHHSLYMVFFYIPVAPMYLHRFSSRPHRCFAGIYLCHRRR